MARIVVGIDGSTHADLALRWAVREAQLRDAELELVHGYAVEVLRTALRESSRELAEGTVAQVVARNGELLDGVKWSTTLTPLVRGQYAHALVEAGDEAELVVVGSRGLDGFAELLLGSTSYRTAGHAPCPVAVVRGGDSAEAARSVVVGIDDSRVARRALRWAVEEATLRRVPLTVVHAYLLPTLHLLGDARTDREIAQVRTWAQERAEAVMSNALATIGASDLPLERVTALGSPAGVLLDHTRPDDLLVVGCRGRTTLGRMVLGSVSHQVLHHAAGTVVVAP